MDSGAHHIRLLEALLFASAEPVSERALVRRLPEGADVGALLEELQGHYAGRGVNLVKVGASWAFRTAPNLAGQLNQEIKVGRKLPRAAVETLAVIAYHQPVTRAEIEEIRGVGMNRGSLDVLLEAGWIRPLGRRRTPGRPVAWGTTDAFLDHFALHDLRDLPGLDELKSAGFLDSRPALELYSVTGSTQPANDEGESGEAENEDAASPLDPDDCFTDPVSE
jgi:segregation and condensation protein B